MPKVVDAARVTTPSNTVWRTCDRCSRLQPLPEGADQCDNCAAANQSPTAAEKYAATGWKFTHRYAELVGAISAWAEVITDVSDAERLDRIRHLLRTQHPMRNSKAVK
jgi:hypothetical protein